MSSAPSPMHRDVRLLQLLVGMQLVAVFALGSWLLLRPAAGPAPTSRSADDLRSIAADLRASGLVREALPLYESYLEQPGGISGSARAALSAELGGELLEAGHYEQALVWLYSAERYAPGSEGARQAELLTVRALEALGRTHQAAHVQDRATEPMGQQTSSQGPVLATIGAEQITVADLDAALDELPPELRVQIQGPAARRGFARQLVARRALYRRAQREGLDQDPEVRRAVESAGRDAVVDQLMRRELAGDLTADPADVENFFEANRDRYGGEPTSFESVADQVAQDYLQQRVARRIQSLMEEALAGEDVRFDDEALDDSAGAPPRIPGVGRSPSLFGGGAP